jgi:hypothetical protein
MTYCPKCKSRIFPGDEEYLNVAGVCSYCVTYDRTPDKRFFKAWENYKASQVKKTSRSLRRQYSSSCPGCGSTKTVYEGDRERCADCGRG